MLITKKLSTVALHKGKLAIIVQHDEILDVILF